MPVFCRSILMGLVIFPLLVSCGGSGSDSEDMEQSTESTRVSAREKLDMLTAYAPRVWFHSGEQFFPAPVEWAFPHQVRSAGPDGNFWLSSVENLAEPSSLLAFFAGCDGSATSMPCALADTPVYAFWVEKRDSGRDEAYIDLIYFFYYPYNRGKEVLATVWGNHVGDWEHVSVRLLRGQDTTTGWPYRPAQIHLSAHSFGATFDWDAIAKTNATHPVVYAAEGSHGLWQTAGVHVYETLPIVGNLSDSTNAGTAWDTWNRVEAFDFDLQQGLAGSAWPLWMDDDFKSSGVCASTDPACGAIFRWGNQERGCDILGIDIGICRLENGPTGPVSKGVWSPGPLQ